MSQNWPGTARETAERVSSVMNQMAQRITELEAENRQLKAALGARPAPPQHAPYPPAAVAPQSSRPPQAYNMPQMPRPPMDTLGAIFSGQPVPAPQNYPISASSSAQMGTQMTVDVMGNMAEQFVGFMNAHYRSSGKSSPVFRVHRGAKGSRVLVVTHYSPTDRWFDGINPKAPPPEYEFSMVVLGKSVQGPQNLRGIYDFHGFNEVNQLCVDSNLELRRIEYNDQVLESVSGTCARWLSSQPVSARAFNVPGITS
jgi:hypothetical protein